jgi:DNA sulfur modification protein DndE
MAAQGKMPNHPLAAPDSDSSAAKRPPRWQRLRLSRELTYRVRNLKKKTGLTPNLVCRLGLCLSLAEPQIPDPATYDEEGQEFNRSTLLGEWDELFEALLRQRLANDGLNPVVDFIPQLRAHMNRGSEMICNRVREVADVAALMPRGDESSRGEPDTEGDDGSNVASDAAIKDHAVVHELG